MMLDVLSKWNSSSNNSVSSLPLVAVNCCKDSEIKVSCSIVQVNKSLICRHSNCVSIKARQQKNLCMKFSVDAEKLQVIKISLQLFNTVTFIAHCATFKWVTNHHFGSVRKHVQQIVDTATNISAKTCSFAQQRELGSSTQSCHFFLGALFSNKNLHSLSSKLPVLAVGCQTVDGMLLANGRHGSRVLFGFIALLSMGCHHITSLCSTVG